MSKERFEKGHTVFTFMDNGSKDWEDNKRARNRPWNVYGIVYKVCYWTYLVTILENGHLTGRQEYYYHDELLDVAGQE